MSDIAIQVENLAKCYRIGGPKEPYGTLRDTLVSAAQAPLRILNRSNRRRNDQEFWALRDISFEVKHGEVLGIIGRNGAGKSTLLKILSRITKPTSGRAVIHGRVGSLLEVGTGFHPELTGRENIYLNGAILGMSKAEIDRKFDEIVDFAEIERFLDTPVKRYSSGMYMRLAFSIAAHLEPEILIVDEVLAVGDAAFQKKCLGKMSDVAREGRTVLFVSHNMLAVQSLCNRVIWLRQGELADQGNPGSLVARYLQVSSSTLNEQVWSDRATAPGNDIVRLRRVCVRPVHGDPSDPISIRTPIMLEFEYWNLIPDTYLNLSLYLYNEQGVIVLNTVPAQESAWHGKPFPAGLFRSQCIVPGDLLNDGVHRVELLVVQDQGVVICRQDNILAFEVRDSSDMRGAWYGKWPGAVRPNLHWSTQFVNVDR